MKKFLFRSGRIPPDKNDYQMTTGSSVIKNRFSKPLFGALSEQFAKVIPYKKSTDANAEVKYCALCGQSEVEVKHMVMRDRGAVCGDCLMVGMISLERQTNQKVAVPRLPVVMLIELIADTENAVHVEVESKVVELLYEIRDDHPEVYRLFMDEFAKRGLWMHVSELLEHLPPEEWTGRDLITWTRTNLAIGDYESALENPIPELHMDDPRSASEWAYYQLCAKVELAESNEEWRSLFKSFDKLRSALSDDRSLLRGIDVSCARCLYEMGDMAAARAKLSNFLDDDDTDARALMLAGDIADKDGRPDRALQLWQKSFALAEPGLMRERLAERLELDCQKAS